MSENDLEGEYFARLDAEKRAALRAKLESEHGRISAEERKKLHYLKCGKCGSDMTTRPFRGLEIEECANCGAVLLDPGELQTLAGEDQTAWFASFFSFFGGGKG